jgi:hypothetical protein
MRLKYTQRAPSPTSAGRLGSGLTDYIQKMTAAAMQIAEK